MISVGNTDPAIRNGGSKVRFMKGSLGLWASGVPVPHLVVLSSQHAFFGVRIIPVALFGFEEHRRPMVLVRAKNKNKTHALRFNRPFWVQNTAISTKPNQFWAVVFVERPTAPVNRPQAAVFPCGLLNRPF